MKKPIELTTEHQQKIIDKILSTSKSDFKYYTEDRSMERDRFIIQNGVVAHDAYVKLPLHIPDEDIQNAYKIEFWKIYDRNIFYIMFYINYNRQFSFYSDYRCEELRIKSEQIVNYNLHSIEEQNSIAEKILQERLEKIINEL